jgi:Mg-chelatase subunit ChlI
MQEGELRPQLLDRFGMSVNVRTLLDVAQRTQLVLDRLAFEQDQEAFIESVREEQEALTAKLVAARELLPK